MKIVVPATSLEDDLNISDFDIKVNNDGVRRSAFDILRYKEYDWSDVSKVWPELSNIDPDIQEQISIDAQYAGYVERQMADIKAYKRDENLVIPEAVNYDEIGSLSNELRQKLDKTRPETLGAAARIQGMTPSALVSLLRYVKKSA